MDELELPLPLNDMLSIELPKGSTVSYIKVDNDVGWIGFNLSDNEEIQRRRFIIISEFTVQEDSYVFVGTLRTSEGTFDVCEVIDL